MLRKVFAIPVVFLTMAIVNSNGYAGDETVFDQDLRINRWHLHFSHLKFRVDDPGHGIISITKNSPHKKIKSGFIFFNGTFISFRKFLSGNTSVFEKEIVLKSKNRLTVFLIGAPRASVKLEIRPTAASPPEIIIFAADPAVIQIGEFSMLTWQTRDADTCAITPEIGSVDANGTVAVRPATSTIYTLTAFAQAEIAAATVTVRIENSAPRAKPQIIVTDEDTPASIILTGSDPDGDSLTFEIKSPPLHGSFEGLPPEITDTSLANCNGTDAFTFSSMMVAQVRRRQRSASPSRPSMMLPLRMPALIGRFLEATASR